MLPIILAQNLPANLQIKVPPEASTVLLVICGIVVLLFGRSLYWAFVGIAGFLVGMALAQEWLADKSELIQILAALGCGILGAILAIVLQRLAFAIGGFFAGGYLASILVMRLHPGDQNMQIWMIVGGVIGAILAAMLMDWAIIVLSSLAGAAAILSPFQTKLDQQVLGILFLVLAAVGIIFQGRLLARRPPAGPPAAAPQV